MEVQITVQNVKLDIWNKRGYELKWAHPNIYYTNQIYTTYYLFENCLNNGIT
jgi:hypothetical protein